MTGARKSCHTALVPVKPSPVVAVPAATLVLLRDRPHGGVETLLIERHRASRFAAGDFVFPGGKVEPADAAAEAVSACAGLDADEASHRLGMAPCEGAAMGYWTAAIREAFEEVGVLLAYGADGHPARIDAARADDYRHACQVDVGAFWGMVRTEGLTLATDRLTYFAHWVTPEENPLRFDTRFFAAAVPTDQHPSADEREIVTVRWLSPAEALQAQGRGEISLRLPTVKNLTLFAEADSTADALRRLAAVTVTRIRPRLVVENGQRRAILPGEPGYY